MEAEDTSDLIRQAAAGDATAFRRLAECHYMLVYKIAYKWCGRREDAEDIAQEVFIKLPEKLGLFRGEAGFTTWLYRLTINAAKDYGRKSGATARRELPFTEGFDAASDEPGAERKLIAAEAYGAIHALPPPVRDAVLLVFAEEMSHGQAAKVLGCAETTVSWRIFQARKLLKPMMAGNGPKRAYGR